MYMTSLKLIGLRLVMITFGRWPWFAERFKEFMVRRVVVNSTEERYVASSRYFTLDQLEPERPDSPPRDMTPDS
ncbi:MAG: hypothetical protein HPY51_03985 [Candidatus Omnitrophica bacterium]|nr:hypothetical protein [Candidatus Omnitrophota bacterium]